MLGAGYAEQAALLDNRVIEVAIGAAVGIAVNMLIRPPSYEREAARDILNVNQGMETLLVVLADKFKDRWDEETSNSWLHQLDDLSADLSAATAQVEKAAEARKGNIHTFVPRLRPDNGLAHTIELDNLDYAAKIDPNENVRPGARISDSDFDVLRSDSSFPRTA